MMRIAALLTLVLLSLPSGAWSQTIKLQVRPVTFEKSPLGASVNFLCSAEYSRSACVQDTKAVAIEVASHRNTNLEAWTFLLVPASEWRETVHGLHRDPSSPAFSLLDERITVLESSLSQATPERAKDFLEMFGVSGPPLLQLAVTHEMSHALCADRDEQRANENSARMRQGLPIVCRPEPSRAVASTLSGSHASGK